MGRWLIGVARLFGTAIGAFLGIVAIQLYRLRRMEFLPLHPGFDIDHVVEPSGGTWAAGEAPLRLAVLGDSTAAGVGVDRPEYALPHLVAQRVADAERRAVHVVNYGWAGARVEHLVPEQLPRALRPLRETDADGFLPGADVVAIVIGANDATHRTRPTRLRADLRATFQAIRAAAPQARIVHAGIPRFRGALRTLEPLMFLTDHYARLLRPISQQESARAGAAYANLARDVPPRIRGRTDVLASDHFHLSPVGYAAWADVIVDALYADAAGVSTSPLATSTG